MVVLYSFDEFLLGVSCVDDVACEPFYAKCVYHNTYSSCHCTTTQMLVGSMCEEGEYVLD